MYNSFYKYRIKLKGSTANGAKLQTPWSEISVGNRDGGFQASN